MSIFLKIKIKASPAAPLRCCRLSLSRHQKDFDDEVEAGPAAALLSGTWDLWTGGHCCRDGCSRWPVLWGCHSLPTSRQRCAWRSRSIDSSEWGRGCSPHTENAKIPGRDNARCWTRLRWPWSPLELVGGWDCLEFASGSISNWWDGWVWYVAREITSQVRNILKEEKESVQTPTRENKSL